MGFGYHESRASGVTGFAGPKTVSQMNSDLGWRAGEKLLREIVKKHPRTEPVIRKMIAQQAAENLYSFELIIIELKRRKLLPQSD